MIFIQVRLLFLLALLMPLTCIATDPSPQTHTKEQEPRGGILFNCPATNLDDLSSGVQSYLSSLGIPISKYMISEDKNLGLLRFSLINPTNSTNTLHLIDRPDLDIKEELVEIPRGKQKIPVLTVSKKEIALSMLQYGRISQFEDSACKLDVLKDQVGIRQNLVAWTESIEWMWLDGKPAKRNNRYWIKGKYNPKFPLDLALEDMYIHPRKYFFGCYTATKILIVSSTLDYYKRIKNDPITYKAITNRLLKNGDPLGGIEPSVMWSFESDYQKTYPDPHDHLDSIDHIGKLVRLSDPVPSDNFIPGDWTYFANTDDVSSKKNGYEGANAIYLGRGLFSDYYNDNNHHFTFKEQIDEVYQWRNHVYSRPQDNRKITPLSESDIEQLSKSIHEGGLLLDYRAIPVSQ